MNKEDKIGAFWTRDSKSGQRYLSGHIEWKGEKIAITAFKNSYKEEGSKQPDFIIYKSMKQGEKEEVF